jgi:hypothetical protein
MNIFARSVSRRTAAFAGTAATITIAVTTTVATQPAGATQEPATETPCFIVQPRWNTAIDGPPPTCTSHARQQPASPSGAWSAPRPGVDFGP